MNLNFLSPPLALPLQDGRVFIWTCDDPAGNTWTAKLLHKFNDVVWHVSWSITGNILAVSGGDNKVSRRVWPAPPAASDMPSSLKFFI